MISAVDMSGQSGYSPQFSAAGKQEAEELTTVTTHCNKNHQHTPACPHTTFTHPVGGIEGKGQYLDVFA